MRIKAIIFDLDGTIINTEHMWAAATRDMLLARNIDYTPQLQQQIHNAIHGLSISKGCSVLKTIINLQETVEQLAQEKKTRAYNLFQNNIQYIEGFLEFYARVRSENLKTAIATNCNMPFVALADQEVSLRKLFGEHIYTVDDVTHAKPHPELYLLAAQKIGIDPAECIVIEDSLHGIMAAKNAGMYCIAINTAGNRDNLVHADHIVEKYEQILLKV